MTGENGAWVLPGMRPALRLGVLGASLIEHHDRRILPAYRVSTASASTISRISYRTSSNIGLFGQAAVSDGPKQSKEGE
jgi:hypothetical protein